MSTSPDLWGQDIALDESGQAKIAASGELILTDGLETGLQDIRLRLFTRLGTLFYDEDFGSLLHDWILEESTEANRAAFCSEVVMRVEADPRVELGSVSCSVLLWDERQLTARVRWTFIGEDHPLNLVLQIDKSTQTAVIQDVHISEALLASRIQDA
ncbi:baseplate assembly protein [uncultured Bilophila sp.]|uniref:baseplate assembly protein n=1 Tax=uncultured Bilophila sp. TaxID=529385 RepID=UPI0025FFD9BC|nr:baseplate assembly protein [uncultured Bilophila sp.]